MKFKKYAVEFCRSIRMCYCYSICSRITRLTRIVKLETISFPQLRNIENSIQYSSNGLAEFGSSRILLDGRRYSSTPTLPIPISLSFLRSPLTRCPILLPSLASFNRVAVPRFLIVSVCLFVSFFFRRYVLPGPSLPSRPSTSLFSNFSRAPPQDSPFLPGLSRSPRAFQTSPSSLVSERRR